VFKPHSDFIGACGCRSILEQGTRLGMTFAKLLTAKAAEISRSRKEKQHPELHADLKELALRRRFNQWWVE
jgi:hypothetical protein